MHYFIELAVQLSTISDENLSILKNEEIIAINQDPVVGTAVSPFRWGINVCIFSIYGIYDLITTPLRIAAGLGEQLYAPGAILERREPERHPLHAREQLILASTPIFSLTTEPTDQYPRRACRHVLQPHRIPLDPGRPTVLRSRTSLFQAYTGIHH